MKTQLIPAIKLTIICILFLVVVYSALIGVEAYVIAPNHGRGENVMRAGKVVGYTNIGQTFSKDQYFWSRPSAVNYNAAGSAGSNKGASNADYLKTVQARIDTLLVHNPGIQKSQIPVEMVTASGSGLDPDISPAAAMIQARRIASVRGRSEQAVIQLIVENTEDQLLGLFGPRKVNVLKLNLALDSLK